MKKNIKIILLTILLLLAITPTGIYAAKKSDEIKVIPGGEPFGIKLFSEGVVVTKIESFEVEGTKYCPAEKAEIKVNDIIISANDKKISNNSEFKKIIENSSGQKIELKIKRDDKEIVTSLTPIINENSVYKAGMWIKDSAAGLGTITFYCEENNSFCGLGHGICETDTGMLMPLSYGDTESAFITSVSMSKNGNVGTLNGYFSGNRIGTAVKNNEIGVYGLSTSTNYKEYMEIADTDDVNKGKAYILTTIYGDTPKAYEIKILKVKRKDANINMIIEVTDEELLSVTGGIVQGMSGSPIIQDGKIVGALTHVLVDDVTKGYGVFAKTMYDEMMSIS